MYRWIDLTKPSDAAKVLKFLPEDYRLARLKARLESIFSDQVKGILVEYPYVDRDYRSTYYGYYAKKGRAYSPFCARLHFFGPKASFVDACELRFDTGSEREAYLGYMVLRPTPPTLIGRSVLNPRAVVGASGQMLVAKHVVHLLGHRLEVSGFPYMEQHTDISVCAHAACWSILRHYSERHRKYAEVLTYGVTELASRGQAGGMAPSRGLQIDQVAQVFAQSGHFPDVYYRRSDTPLGFTRRLLAYVASGLPVFASVKKTSKSPNASHAVTVIGHHNVDRKNAFDEPVADRVVYCSEAIDTLIVMDDNCPPYWTVPMNGDKDHYGISQIDAFVVPLPEKVFFAAEHVEKWVEATLFDTPPLLDLDFSVVKKTTPVINYYLTTSANFRNYLDRNRTSFPPDLLVALMELCLPQFIWVVDIADLTEWRQGRSNIMFVADATSGPHDQSPFFVIHDTQTAFIYDRAVTNQLGSFAFGGEHLKPRAPLLGNLVQF